MAKRKTRTAEIPSAPPASGDGAFLNLYSAKWGKCRRVPIIARSKALRFHAFRWSYLIRNRTRWAYDNSNQALEMVGSATRLLLWLVGAGATPGGPRRELTPDQVAKLQELGAAEMIEVSIPFEAEATGWEYRIIPWEYVLPAATQKYRGRGSFFVVRHLRRNGAKLGAKSQDGFLHIESAPPQLRRDYDFATERVLARQLAGPATATLDDGDCRLEDPTLAEIGERIRKSPPRAIHLSGFDSWLASAELKVARYAKRDRDGYLVANPDRTDWDITEAEALAESLIDPASPPRLVSFNIYNSGTRLAAMCVARGASAAIGYQDTFDARLGEQFFAAFNHACTATDWDIAGSARYAWERVLQSRVPLTGSGMIVWADESIEARPPTPCRELAAKVAAQFRRKLSAEEIQDGLELEIEPRTRMNYSALHNHGSLFDSFILRRKPGVVGEITDVCVRIRLQIGSDVFPFETRVCLTVNQMAVDLAREIVISLTSDLVRAVRDQIQTTLFVEVSHGNHVFYARTHRILLLPIDEWIDAGQNWLPSFVLPGDPAVRKIIDDAQKYLVALRDDTGTGFDGYQGVDTEDLDNSEAVENKVDPAEACETVDYQVRAIWAALLLDSPLAYINPPPVFTESSQRVRTPSDTMSGRRGTCIDLALLLAACLEYVEIYPAIVLLSGHAFPAYWRHSDYLDRFMSGRDVSFLPESDDDLDPDYVAALLGQDGRWRLGKGHYQHILQAIEEGKLVPIETVMLTSRGSFADAVDEGRRNFVGVDDFDSLMDINRARTDPVRPITPLPIRREE